MKDVAVLEKASATHVLEWEPVSLHTWVVRTYYACMNITLSVDDRLVEEARKLAQVRGTSVNQLVRDYLELGSSRRREGASPAS